MLREGNSGGGSGAVPCPVIVEQQCAAMAMMTASSSWWQCQWKRRIVLSNGSVVLRAVVRFSRDSIHVEAVKRRSGHSGHRDISHGIMNQWRRLPILVESVSFH